MQPLFKRLCGIKCVDYSLLHFRLRWPIPNHKNNCSAAHTDSRHTDTQSPCVTWATWFIQASTQPIREQNYGQAVCVWVCVSVRGRKREGERERERAMKWFLRRQSHSADREGIAGWETAKKTDSRAEVKRGRKEEYFHVKKNRLPHPSHSCYDYKYASSHCTKSHYHLFFEGEN